MLDVKNIKKDFKIFENNPDLVYLDSGATSLKPKSVIDKIVEYYQNYPANIHRGIYKISEIATEEYENTRKIAAQFINARNSTEIVFTRNTTEGINLIAYSLGRKIIEAGDEIVTSIMEHHSNFVPWQQLAIENEAVFKVIDIDSNYQLPITNDKIISKKTKILALTHVSNVLGTVNPIKEIIAAARKINPKIIIVVDGAQAVPHMKVDVQDLGCDFLVFSAHKMLGPPGVGVLWGKAELLNHMFPFQMGGGMIAEVKINETIFAEIPTKFEAGTPDIANIIAFKEAIKYLRNIDLYPPIDPSNPLLQLKKVANWNKMGIDKVRLHEKELTVYAIEKIKQEFGNKVKIYGPDHINDRGGIITFTFNKYHPHDVAQILDEDGICVRAGHHCTMPLHHRLGVNATVRASFYIYNDKNDVDKLINGLRRVEKIL